MGVCTNNLVLKFKNVNVFLHPIILSGNVFSLKLKISITTELIELSIFGELDKGLGYLFKN